jgi:hypothetical protein
MVHEIAMMSRKILTILLSIVLIFVVGGYLVYRNAPPYYYQSKLFFMLNKDDLQALAKRFKQEDIKRVELVGSDSVEVEFNNGEGNRKLSEGQIAEYTKLLFDAHVSPVWKVKNGILFYIGADSKFGNNFQIAYLLLDTVTGDEPVCDHSIKDEGHGTCFVLLDNDWAINYQWVN